MSKRISILCCCLLLLLPLMASPARASSWSDAAIAYAKEANILPPGVPVKNPATRAEFAHMITRLLGVHTSTSLEDFSDVDVSHPYAQALGDAVSLGLLNGSDGKLNPDAPVTREQAFVILARAFALEPDNLDYLDRFTDRNQIGDWAASAIAGMTKLELVTGSNGMLRPRNPISIEELAQLLLNITCRAYNGGGDSGGTAITRITTECSLSPVTIDGDLYLCFNKNVSATLNNLVIHGRLVVRGSGTLILEGTQADAVILCDKGITLYNNRSNRVIAKAAVTIYGGATCVEAGDGSTSLFDGDGVILRRGKYDKLLCTGGIVTIENDAIIDRKNIRIGIYGLDEELPSSDMATDDGNRVWKKVFIPPSPQQEIPVAVPTDSIPGSVVETIAVKATFNTGSGLFEDMELKNYIGWVNKDTVATYVNYFSNVSAKVQLPDGQTGWVPWYAVDISTENYVRENDYTTSEKEDYVNESGYASDTSYLVWVSLKCQRVNVFTGSAGNWKLTHSFLCATGKNSTPTIAGVFSYQLRHDRWNFGDYYVEPVLVFNGGHAFHSRTYTPDGKLLDARLGTPVSAGCVRMLDEDVAWLDRCLTLGSTVVVY